MKKFKEFFVNSFFYYLAIELVEEILEDLIAMEVSKLILTGVSTFLTVAVSYAGKLCLKRIIKNITYKEGNDKVNKIKQFFTWVFCNKKTILGTASTALIALGGTEVIDVCSLPELNVNGFNLTPILYYVLLGVFALVGVYGKGLEKIKTFFDRMGLIKKQKEQKALVNEVKKELANEQKIANKTKAQQEKARIKAEEEQKAKIEKERADAEHKSKVDEIKAKLVAEAKAKEQQ